MRARILWLLVLLILCAPIAQAQVGTEPMAWAPQYRPLAEGIGDALLALQGEEAVRADVKAWQAGDHRPVWRDVCSISVAMLTVEGLKRSIHEPRPDGSDNLSNPSGHSAAAAALTRTDRTLSVSITFVVGMSRSWANKHHFWGPGKAKDIPIGWAIGAGAQALCGILVK